MYDAFTAKGVRGADCADAADCVLPVAQAARPAPATAAAALPTPPMNFLLSMRCLLLAAKLLAAPIMPKRIMAAS
jgi:hypothetical protein